MPRRPGRTRPVAPGWPERARIHSSATPAADHSRHSGKLLVIGEARRHRRIGSREVGAVGQIEIIDQAAQAVPRGGDGTWQFRLPLLEQGGDLARFEAHRTVSSRPVR